MLAIVGPAERDSELLDELQRRHPDRVTVLLQGAADGWGSDETETARACRDRLAALLRAIEERTGATVVGLAGDSEQLRGWRFDRVVGGSSAQTTATLRRRWASRSLPTT